MQVLQIINQVGPLPLKAQFDAPLDGPTVLLVTGSLRATAVNVPMQLQVFLDGNNLLGTAHMWSNGDGTHRAMPTLLIGFNLPYGQHTLSLALNGANVTSDLNDFFTAALIY